jgi:hypothetical protein
VHRHSVAEQSRSIGRSQARPVHDQSQSVWRTLWILTLRTSA